MKLGLFGGGFDPIHLGHILPVEEARRKLALDRVIFLPTAVPPHKPGWEFAPAHARYSMVELALLGREGLYASPFELTPDRPAYTVDSVEHFGRLHPEADLYLILGGDGFAQLTEWKRWRDLPRLARLAVLVRPDWRLEDLAGDLEPELAELAAGDRVRFVANRPVDVSATRLRELLGAGLEVPDGVLPELVLQYIRKYSLYR
jgi:nicotinate-nucleotide adenylyltransferase